MTPKLNNWHVQKYNGSAKKERGIESLGIQFQMI